MRRNHLFVSVAVMLVLTGAAWAGIDAIDREARRDLATQERWRTEHSWSQRTGAPLISLTTVDPQRLAKAGLELTPSTKSPAFSRAEAAVAAASELGPGAIREIVLADCHWETVNPPINQTCWVISKSPVGHSSHGPPGAPPVAITFAVVLLDADTGAFLKGISGS